MAFRARLDQSAPIGDMVTTARHQLGALVAVAVAVVLLIDVLPVWLLSVTTIYGQAGGTSTYQMIGFALVWFVIAGFAIPLARLPHALVVAAAIAGGARLLLQAGIGPNFQVYASSVAVLGVLGWLVVLAVRGVSGTALVRGLASGVASSAVLRAALGGVDPMWQDNLLGWLVMALLVGLLIYGSLEVSRQQVTHRASGLAWFATGPTLILAMLLTAAPLRATVTALPTGRWPQLVVILGCVVGAVLTARPVVPRYRLVGAITLIVLVMLAVLPRTIQHGIHGLMPRWAVLPQALGAVALGIVLGQLSAPSRSGSGPARTGLAAWAGQLTMVVGTLLFFAVQEVLLPYSPDAVLVASAVLLGVLVMIAPAVQPGTAQTTQWRTTVMAAAISVLLLLPTLTRPLPPAAIAGHGFPVRLVSYNIHVGGISEHGRYDEHAIADVIQAQHPDIVWLSEVDRGWLVDGDHDALPALARTLGMRYVYAPASGADWGDAVLSRYPVHTVEQQPLPKADAPTGAEALAAEIDVGHGHRLAVVGTHLQTLDDNLTVPVAQTRAVAAMATRLAGSGLPVVVTGDLNDVVGSGALAPLDSAFKDGLARWRPVATFPAGRPTQGLDQLYITPNLVTSKLSVPASAASDHRPIAVTLTTR